MKAPDSKSVSKGEYCPNRQHHFRIGRSYALTFAILTNKESHPV
jgi:hypothetical protein